MVLHVLSAVLAVAAAAEVVMASATHRGFGADALGAPPAGFTFARTGKGAQGRWEVRADPSEASGRVLAQVDPDGTDYRFPVAIADAPVLKDVRAEVRCKAVAGQGDRACGLIVRYQDADHYYVARANALEDNVRLYRMVAGKREQLASWSGTVTSDAWHTLALAARGDRFTVWWDQTAVIEASDATYGAAGRVGLWTKADSITWFDDLVVQPLP